MTLRISLVGTREEIENFLDDLPTGVNSYSLELGAGAMALDNELGEYVHHLTWESPV